MTDGDASALTTALVVVATFSFAVTYLMREDRTASKGPTSPVAGLRMAQRTDRKSVKYRYLYAAIGATVLVGTTVYPLKILWDEHDRDKAISYPKCIFVLACAFWAVAATRLWFKYSKLKA